MMNLKAIVIGAGWAGEGHTVALRAAGVEVVAMCGRTPEPARAMAGKLAVPEVRFDWQQALAEFKPDIVAIATQAAPHRQMAEAAAALGCHVVCDKPLAVNSQEARAMLLAVERAGVKHAYGATSRYSPAVLYARQLLASGFIGQVREIESSVHFGVTSWPYHWVHQLSQGGGMLNNGFTHKLAQALYLTGGEPQAVMGRAHLWMGRVPVGATLHDFRELFQPQPTPREGEKVSWREVDADSGCTVLLQLRMSDGQTVNAMFQGSATSSHRYPEFLALFGDKGTLHLTGPTSPDRIEHYDRALQEWRDVPVPQAIMDSFPHLDDITQRDWNQFFGEFVADVRGEGYAGYPTFRDGWIANEIIDIVRAGQNWTPLPENP